MHRGGWTAEFAAVDTPSTFEGMEVRQRSSPALDLNDMSCTGNQRVDASKASDGSLRTVKTGMGTREPRVLGMPECVVHEFANIGKGLWRMVHGLVIKPWATPTGRPKDGRFHRMLKRFWET
ncbi:MAG TPA: hypothetical protein GX517_06645 [Alicyclobacillus sp.]|nr:hypothetical protein [Alicyclobacillus sp.]